LLFPAMKLAILGLVAAVAPAAASGVTPIQKVVQLLSDFEAKILKEGEEAQKLYEEYSEWCEDRARQLGHEIKTGTAESESLKAAIAEEEATTTTLNAKIEDLASAIATDEADLKAATEIREHEHSEFVKEEAELAETVDMLKRAIGILEREMAKGGAAMLQMRNINNLADALKVMVQASALSSADASKLSAFVQTQQQAKEDAEDQAEDAELGAPAAAVYEGHSGDILEVLEGLTDKAEEQLGDLRKKETTDLHNFQMLEQSLEDELKFANKDLSEAKKALSASAEAKSTSEGDLAMTSEELKSDTEAKAELHQSCMTKAEDFEAETKSRGEELTALATAKQVIQESTGGAEKASYSFLQTARSTAASGHFAILGVVRTLAQKHNSPALAQLAQRMGAVMRSSADPFEKVRGLITDMIAKLEEEAEKDATKKAYCDKELKESGDKKADKSAEVEKLSTKIEQMRAKSAELKEEVVQLQADLAALAKAQAEADKLREEEHTAYVKNQADLEQGLNGVKLALKVLNEYYGRGDQAHESQSGGAASIIGLLEVVESDFSKDLAEVEAVEESAATQYETETKEAAVEKVAKTKDVEFKTKESVQLEEEAAALSTDLATVQEELDAVLEYLSKIHKECDEVAETYEQRKARYEAEIAGLKEALNVLESETALIQRRASHHRALRGSA